MSDTPICFLRRGRRTSSSVAGRQSRNPLIRFLSRTGLVTVGHDLEGTLFLFPKSTIYVVVLKIRTNSDESYHMCNNQSAGRDWGWLGYFGSYSVILSRLNVTTNMQRSFHSLILFTGSTVLSGTSASCLKLLLVYVSGLHF